VGAAVFVSPPSSTDELMVRADELMYAAKREAKGTIRVATYGDAGEQLALAGGLGPR